jgi:hypothetical protein
MPTMRTALKPRQACQRVLRIHALAEGLRRRQPWDQLAKEGAKGGGVGSRLCTNEWID